MHMCWPTSTFPSLMTRYGIGGKVSHGKPRKLMPNSLKCVFLDYASLARPDTSYWRHWPCSHVFHCLAGEAGEPPPGWIARDVRVPHVRVGGSTDAVWHIHHWAPAALMSVPSEPLSREQWTPLFARINPMVETRGPSHGLDCEPPVVVSVAAPMVIMHSLIPGVVLTEGLFPHNRRSLRVLVKSTVARRD